MPDRLTIDTLDADLAPGARNALRVCLQLKSNERITIITDEESADIAAALQAEVEEVGSEFAVFVLMWRIQDFEAGNVGRCTTCFLPEVKTAEAFGQAKRHDCPNCFGHCKSAGRRHERIGWTDCAWTGVIAGSTCGRATPSRSCG